MKKALFLAVAVVFVVIMGTAAGVMAVPSMPDDLSIVQPDPSLPKELAAFSGKWGGGRIRSTDFFMIVEKINEEKATLYFWRSDKGWNRREANVVKERGKWKICFSGPSGQNELSLRKGEKYLDLYAPAGTITFTRVL